MRSDPCNLLGVDPGASAQQIQAAYLHWATRFAPEGAEPLPSSFRQVQQAYSILSASQRGRAYGSAASVTQAGAEPLRGTPGEAPRHSSPAIDFDLRDSPAKFQPSFDELFARLWSNFASISRPKAERIESLTIEIPLTGAEAAQGGRARILIPARAACAACDGHGCLGPYECWQCQGHGSITADFPITLSYPAGMLDEHVVQLPLTQFGIENLYLTIRFRVGSEPL